MRRGEFEGWVATALEGFREIPPHDELAMLFAVDEKRTFVGQPLAPGLVFRAFTQDDYANDSTAVMNQVLLDGPPRTIAAMATRVHWSPEPEVPTTNAWLATVVTPSLPAVFAVSRWAEDDLWWPVPGEDAPWLILSCASGLRAAMISAEPLVLKTNSDARLMRAPSEGYEPPPPDEHGRI